MADKSTKDKNWFAKHKVITVILAFVAIGIISSALGGSSSKTDGSKGNSANKVYKFTDRADKQPTDVEVAVGEPATVGGVKMTLTAADRKTSLSEFETAPEGKQYLIVSVQLENTSDKTHPFNPFDFKVQTAGGQVLDPSFTSTGSDLKSGDLVAGGKTSGTIVMEVPVETGSQYVIWKPGLESDRAIVKVQ